MSACKACDGHRWALTPSGNCETCGGSGEGFDAHTVTTLRAQLAEARAENGRLRGALVTVRWIGRTSPNAVDAWVAAADVIEQALSATGDEGEK